MDSRLRWSPQAAEDFESIVSYIRENSGQEQALAVGQRLYAHITSIVDWPRMGKPLTQRPGCRQRVFNKTYKVMYRVISEDVVELVRVFHTRRDDQD